MTGGNLDDLIEQMKKDDLEGATKLPPIQYAKLRGIYPQKVYAALRSRRLEWSTCECGRKVVVVDDADKFFRLGQWNRTHEDIQAEEEASGS